jgi:hypothetical protein
MGLDLELAFQVCLRYSSSMNMEPAADDNALRLKIRRETETIVFNDLAMFYARGQIIAVGGTLNLVEVAFEMSRDNSALIEDLMQRKLIRRMDDDSARQWFADRTVVLTTVVSPWVLVQKPGDTAGCGRTGDT